MLKEQVVLVTGGGRGLGEAICKSLAKAGAISVVTDIRPDFARAVAKEITSTGARAFALETNVGDEAQARQAIDRTLAEFGRFDILVNNAAVDLTVPVEELAVSEWDRIMATNLRGPFLMSKYALAAMRPRKRGHIVNIASTASKRTWANASVYHASKWGLLGFSHALHVEARQAGIKVTAVISGGMRTPFLLDRFPDIDVATLQDPANVAETVRFVLSQPRETVIPEVMVIPMRETSWP